MDIILSFLGIRSIGDFIDIALAILIVVFFCCFILHIGVALIKIFIILPIKFIAKTFLSLKQSISYLFISIYKAFKVLPKPKHESNVPYINKSNVIDFNDRKRQMQNKR